MDDDRMSVSSGSSNLYDPADPVVASTAVAQSTAADPSHQLLATPPHVLGNGHGVGDAPDQRPRPSGGGAAAGGSVTLGPHGIADGLPIEIWQHVLSYLTPPELGRAMRVSKLFLHCLDGSIPAQKQSGTPRGALPYTEAESIWATWRINHPDEAGNMPKPLDGHTERDMWRLIRGIRCDVCDKSDTEPRKPISPDRWHGGPTMSTTRAVWPFALRMCGECLYRHCEKDTALLCNPSIQRFRPALPYAMVTHDFHYIPTTVLKEAGQAPSGLHVAKQYFKPHIESIVADWERTLTLGQGAADEWLKGLSGMGRQTALDSARWEHWEAKGGLNRVLFAFTQLQPAPLLHPTPTPGWVQSNMLGWPLQSVPPQQQLFGVPPNMPTAAFSQHSSTTPMHAPVTQAHNQFSPQAPLSSPFAQPPHQMIHQQSGLQGVQQRSDRKPRDAEEVKAARRQQIEQLCLTELQTPIPPNVLRHMPSFRAAILIGLPLNDHGWEILKPKLLEQYDQAMSMERETTRQLLAVQQQVQAESKRQVNHNNKDTRESHEKEWDEKLRPQRERLGAIADDFVQQSWRGGQSVNSGNVARFAMSVFDHVRKTFYRELHYTDQMTALMGQPIPQDPPDGPFLRRLTLETMKWVYDHKIRPLTRDYGKEIFFCNGAGCEFTNKHFAFEGVIQHYGAKHTNDYSRGNVIVHWQTAEWPEELPFYDPGSGPMRTQHANGGYSRGTTISPQVASGALYGVPSLTTSPFVATPHSNYGSGPFTPPIGSGYPALAEPIQPGLGHFQVAGSASGTAALNGRDPTDLSQFFLAPSTGKPDLASAKAAQDQEAADKLSRIMEELTAKSVPPLAPRLTEAPSEVKKPSILDIDVPDFAAYQDQQNFVADKARFAWSRTNAIDGLPSSVRVFAVIQYALLHFSQRFKTNLSIDTFATALMNISGMDALKHANNLFCNQCQISGSSVPAPLSVATDLWSLTEHFQRMHASSSAAGGAGAAESWAKAMIALPAPETIPELINAAGMKDDKLAILADAFPGQLPRKMPNTKATSDFHESKSNKRSRRAGRKSSNGRKLDFSDGDHGDTEDSGRNGFRSSRSPPDANGTRRRSPKHYNGDGDDEYDPSKPMLPEKPRKRREFGRKPSGVAAGPSLDEMLRIQTEKSNRAAAEENRRRGIVTEIRAEAARADGVDHGSAVFHQLRVASPNSRPGSAPRPPRVYPSDHVVGDQHPSYGGYPTVDRPLPVSSESYWPERAPSMSSRAIREGYDDVYPTGTPPSGRKSRYARYNEQHERMMRDRTRSRSPIRYDEIAYERPQIRQREHLASEQAPLSYRYADEPGVIYDQYGRRLVLVRDDAPLPPGHAVPRHNPEYIDTHHPSVYDPQPYAQPQGHRYAPPVPYENRSAPTAQPPLPVRDTRYAE